MVAGVTAARPRAVRTFSISAMSRCSIMLPVMAAASLFGLRTGLFAGLASSLAYNFFFLPPRGHADDQQS